MTLAYLSVLIVVTFGWLRAPLRFAFLPIYWGAMHSSSNTWQWLPLVACVIIVIGHRLWLRADLADSVRVRDSERRQQLNLIDRLNGWRLQRAARAMGGKRSSARLVALMSTRPSTLFTSLSVLFTTVYLALMPSWMDASALSWWFSCMVAMLLVAPAPIALGQIMLLPLGAERNNVGRILMNVWVRDVWFRLVIGAILGLIGRAFCWWLDLLSFSWQPMNGKVDDQAMLLLWTPLMKAAGLCGVAYAIGWTMSASPRLFKSAGLLGAMPMIVVTGFTAFGAAGSWMLQRFVPALNGDGASVIRLAVVSAILIPLIAWAVNRQLRPQWARANLGELSAVMQAWAAQRQKSLLLS